VSHDLAKKTKMHGKSMTLSYRGHVGWNTSKIISWLISVGFLLPADPYNITVVL